MNFAKFQALAFVVMASSWWSCGKATEVPVEKEKLVMALRDVHVAESAVLHLDSEDKDSMLQVYYGQICEIHNLARPDLDSSIAILKSNPEMAVEYYGRVHEEIEKLNLKNE